MSKVPFSTFEHIELKFLKIGLVLFSSGLFQANIIYILFGVPVTLFFLQFWSDSDEIWHEGGPWDPNLYILQWTPILSVH